MISVVIDVGTYPESGEDSHSAATAGKNSPRPHVPAALFKRKIDPGRRLRRWHRLCITLRQRVRRRAGRTNQVSGSKENQVLFDPSSIIQGILGFYGNLWSLVQQVLNNLFGGLIG